MRRLAFYIPRYLGGSASVDWVHGCSHIHGRGPVHSRHSAYNNKLAHAGPHATEYGLLQLQILTSNLSTAAAPKSKPSKKSVNIISAGTGMLMLGLVGYTWIQKNESLEGSETKDTHTNSLNRAAATAEGDTKGAVNISNPFESPRLSLIIKKREQALQQLQVYMGQKHAQLNKHREQLSKAGGQHNPAAVKRFERQIKEMEEDVKKKSVKLLYDIDDPKQRDNFLAEFGCTKWTNKAIDIVAQFSPLIEIGAGRGQWAEKIRLRGGDILAFDNGSSIPRSDLPLPAVVQTGDETQLLLHKDRTLFLCYPPALDDMAVRCLRLYKGDTLIYIGEGRGGCNANETFFDTLERDWLCERIEEVEPFPGGYEHLYVLRRKESGHAALAPS